MDMGKRDYRFHFFFFSFLPFARFHFFCNDNMLGAYRAESTFAQRSVLQGNFYRPPDIAGVLPVLRQRPAHPRGGDLQRIMFAQPVVFVNILLQIPADLLAFFKRDAGIRIYENFQLLIGAGFDLNEEAVGECLFLEFFREQPFDMFVDHRLKV